MNAQPKPVLAIGAFLVTAFTMLKAFGEETIYVGNWGNGTIMKFDSKGKGTVFASSGLSQPQGLAFDSHGFLFVGNSGNDSVMKFDANGHGTLFAHSSSPSGLAFDSAGQLYVGDAAGSRIWKFDVRGQKTLFADSRSGLSNPLQLAFDKNGNLYVANWANNNILKFDPGGRATIFTSAVSNRPYGLAFDTKGNLYVSNDAGNMIQKFDPNARGKIFAKLNPIRNKLILRLRQFPFVRKLFPVSPPMNSPEGLAFDSAGNLYTPNFWNDNIAKISKNGHVSLFTSAGLKKPIYIVIKNNPGSASYSLLLVSLGCATLLLLGIVFLIYRRRQFQRI